MTYDEGYIKSHEFQTTFLPGCVLLCFQKMRISTDMQMTVYSTSFNLGISPVLLYIYV